MKKCFVVFVFGIAMSSVFAQTLPRQLQRPSLAHPLRMPGDRSAVQVNADAVLEEGANLLQFATNEVVSMVLPVWNVPVGEVREAVEALKSPIGNVCVLDEVNSLLVADVPAKVDEMRKCIRRMDVGEPMMQIEWIRIKNTYPSDIKCRVEEVLRGLSPESFVIADDRTGRLILFSSSPRMVHDLIVRLENCAERKVSAYNLIWANSSNVAARLNFKPQGLLSRRRSMDADVVGATNDVTIVSAVAMSESGPLIVCGTKSRQETFRNEIDRAEVEACPRCEYEVVHTVLKIEDVKTTDEALARVLNLEGKFEAIHSQFFTFRDGESGQDSGQVVSNEGCFRYAFVIGRGSKGGELLWSLTCSNRNDAVCQKSGTCGAEGSVMTIGAAMVGEKTACVFRLSVQGRALQLSNCGETEEGANSARSQGSFHRRPGSPYVVFEDFASLGNDDGQCAFPGWKPSGEYCVTNRYADKPMTRIGDYAFAGCTGLRKVIIPEGVTEIGVSAFLGCSSLRCVVLPTTVTNIGRFAFATTEYLRMPDIVCATGDKDRVRKMMESVLRRDPPRSSVSAGERLRFGGLMRPDAKKAAMQRQTEVIEEALSRIREISDPEPPPVAKPQVKQAVPRQGLLGGGSLRERRLQRRQEAAAAQAQADAEKAQREAKRAEDRKHLLAIQEELRRVREAKAAAEKQKGK